MLKVLYLVLGMVCAVVCVFSLVMVFAIFGVMNLLTTIQLMGFTFTPETAWIRIVVGGLVTIISFFATAWFWENAK